MPKRADMIVKRVAITADEKDLHSPARRVIKSCRRAGYTAKVKRSTNRRERREGEAETELSRW
jgi:hypothetical protein